MVSGKTIEVLRLVWNVAVASSKLSESPQEDMISVIACTYHVVSACSKPSSSTVLVDPGSCDAWVQPPTAVAHAAGIRAHGFAFGRARSCLLDMADWEFERERLRLLQYQPESYGPGINANLRDSINGVGVARVPSLGRTCSL